MRRIALLAVLLSVAVAWPARADDNPPPRHPPAPTHPFPHWFLASVWQVQFFRNQALHQLGVKHTSLHYRARFYTAMLRMSHYDANVVASPDITQTKPGKVQYLGYVQQAAGNGFCVKNLKVCTAVVACIAAAVPPIVDGLVSHDDADKIAANAVASCGAAAAAILILPEA